MRWARTQGGGLARVCSATVRACLHEWHTGAPVRQQRPPPRPCVSAKLLSTCVEFRSSFTLFSRALLALARGPKTHAVGRFLGAKLKISCTNASFRDLTARAPLRMAAASPHEAIRNPGRQAIYAPL
jgi:hypothetical protein